MKDQLKQCREQINRIDDELLRLLNERAAIAERIGHLKEDGIILRPEREAQVLRRLQESNPGPLGNEAIAALFTEVMSQCRALEAPMSVAYLGPEGTFTEAAALKRFGSAIVGNSCATIDDVFRSVENGISQYGVVPVENSTEGAVGRTLDLLLQSGLYICGEVQLAIHQCLLATQCDLKLIETVYSHPQSLGQCQGWLNQNLPHVVRVPVSSNAEAARLAAEHPKSAAIAGSQAALHFALRLCVENIEDDPRNTTRFLVLGKQQVTSSGRDKTSMALSAENKPGAVHGLLASLAKHNVSMTKFESRPSRSGLWEYVFFVDIEGHQMDGRIAIALEELKRSAAFVKILGSYPVAV